MRQLLGAALVFCGCGASLAQPPLDPGIAGTWTGNATILVAGNPPSQAQATLTVVVNGNSATIAGICSLPDTQSVTANGSGESAGWSGVLTCEVLGYGSCPTAVYSYGIVTLSYAASNLTIVSNGSISGCGGSTSLTQTTTAARD